MRTREAVRVRVVRLGAFEIKLEGKHSKGLKKRLRVVSEENGKRDACSRLEQVRKLSERSSVATT